MSEERFYPEMEPPTPDREVRDLVREIVAATAPDELQLLDGLDGIGDSKAIQRLQRAPKREPLGFGLGETLALITPVVWIVVQTVAEKVAEKAAEEVVEKATERGKSWWRHSRNGKGDRKQMPLLTGDEIESARESVATAFADSDRSEEEIAAIADAVEKALKTRLDPR